MENCTEDDDFSKTIRELGLMDQGKELITKMDTVLWSIESLKGPVCDEGEPLYGLVKVKDKQIWISCFRKEKPDARVIPFSELISRFDGISEIPKKVFLKLTPVDRPNEEIDVVMETDGKSPRDKNFILLCSGLKEHNYEGRSIEYCPEGAYYLEPGPPPVVEGIGSNDPGIPLKEGFVFGMDEGISWLGIAVKDDSRTSFPKIGVVVSGLQKLKEFQGIDLTIKETGLVI